MIVVLPPPGWGPCATLGGLAVPVELLMMLELAVAVAVAFAFPYQDKELLSYDACELGDLGF